jgi:Protein of unknown function (DUF551)
MTNWISVKDKLPENKCKVFGFDINSNALYALWFQDNEFLHISACEYFQFLKKIEDIKFLTISYPLPIEGVTHWIPIPEPPKNE